MSKFKVGDKVRVKSNEWYESNKDIHGYVCYSQTSSVFTYQMKYWLGGILTIEEVYEEDDCMVYKTKECPYCVSDFMLEDEVAKESETAKQKFKVGDKVRVKSKEWYDSNKDDYCSIDCSNGVVFIPEMALWLGYVVTISATIPNERYWVKECGYTFSDDMLEDEVVVDDVVFGNPFECDFLEYADVKEGVTKEEANDNSNPLHVQVGGNHYKDMAIQPMEFSMKNGLNACQHTAIKYITRYKYKNGLEDLKKAIHCIELLIEFEYPDKK